MSRKISVGWPWELFPITIFRHFGPDPTPASFAEDLIELEDGCTAGGRLALLLATRRAAFRRRSPRGGSAVVHPPASFGHHDSTYESAMSTAPIARQVVLRFRAASPR